MQRFDYDTIVLGWDPLVSRAGTHSDFDRLEETKKILSGLRLCGYQIIINGTVTENSSKFCDAYSGSSGMPALTLVEKIVKGLSTDFTVSPVVGSAGPRVSQILQVPKHRIYYLTQSPSQAKDLIKSGVSSIHVHASFGNGIGWNHFPIICHLRVNDAEKEHEHSTEIARETKVDPFPIPQKKTV